MPSKIRTILIAALVLAVGAGIFFVLRSKAPQGGAPSRNAPPAAIGEAFENASTTFGASDGTATSTPVAEPVRWDVKLIKSRHVAFTPPKGYWVYFSQSDFTYWLVKGTPPEAGSPDPVESAFANRVAVIHTAVWDHESFPDWERFETTMAQFDCAEGTTSDNLVTCLDARRNERKGATDAGLPLATFSLNAVLQKDQSPRGTRSYAAVRLGANNDNLILVTLTDQSAVSAANALAKSMRIEAK
jgi:hypothetical protein